MQHAATVGRHRSLEEQWPCDFDAAVVAAAAGEADEGQLAMLAADEPAWRAALERLLWETEEHLGALRQSDLPERDQAVADFEGELQRLAAALSTLTGEEVPIALGPAPAPVAPALLQASWSAGRVVVWAGGPGARPADHDELIERLGRAGAPARGWAEHPPVRLPSGERAPARAVPVGEVLGWLAALGAGDPPEGVDASVGWLGRLAVWAVELVARGSVVPRLRMRRASRSAEGGRASEGGRLSECRVHWTGALIDQNRLNEFVRGFPGPVAALERAEARTLALRALGAMVDAILTDAASRVELHAPPPEIRRASDLAEAFICRLDGSAFEAPSAAASELAKRLDRWAAPEVAPADARLVVQLDPPDRANAWFLSVLGPNPEGELVPVERALVDGRSKRHLADELDRLERLMPALLRPGGLRRGQVYLSQEEAWELMTETGAALEAAGFDVRVPALSRQRPSPALRLTTDARDRTVVGARQLTNVAWSVVFGEDVELSAAEIAELAAQARPLVRSRGRWVELDKADLAEAAAALAERAGRTQLTGAEVLRHAMGLEGRQLSGGVSIGGTGWAVGLLERARQISTEPLSRPEGFVGELRQYQAEALAWLGFLDSVGLSGCLALDMGLGKTPTMLAHLARNRGEGVTLVVAPPAVVGNWAAEAARFTPGLPVLVHHGAARASAEELADEIERAEVIITTYATAVRDIEALVQHDWARVVLDEAQAIKNPANETAQQLRRIPARSRVALTGTPIENGLPDLWSILDWANPGLLGSRAAFVAQLSAETRNRRDDAERALRALNGILVFRRTKLEPTVAAELPERIDQLDHCTMTPEQIGLYQAVLDNLERNAAQAEDSELKQGAILAAITALKQICNHPAAYRADDKPLAGRSGKLSRLEEIVDAVFEADEKVLVFTHFAEWGKQLADHLSARTGMPISCYHGGLARGARDRMIADFQARQGPGALVLSLKAGGTGLNLTAASHVVLYDRWWNPAVEDQARDRAWRIGQTRTVVSHRLVCPGTIDERVEEVVAGKRHVADLVLPKSSTLADLDPDQLRTALGLRPDQLLTDTGGAEGVASGEADAA